VNARGAGEAANWNDTDTCVTWMPLTHDMGLIGMHIMMFAHRMQLNVMPTELFIRRPLLWMTFAARKGVTVTSSPNFGYRHYLKVLGERDVGELDLSKLRLVYNGAEPISVELADEFMNRMAPAKLKRTAMYPVYGLAEATLVVSFPQPPGEKYEWVSVDRHELRVGAQPKPLLREHPDALSIMAVGQPIPYSRVRIADDADQELPENHIGHILIGGDNVTKGYYENPQANAQGFTSDGWLRTGDLGMLKGGKLYITGRAKEIIFVNGQNYYPHDIESIAIKADGLELGKVVAAGVRSRGGSTDDLILFVLHRMDMKEFQPIANQVTRLVNEHTGLEVAHVVPVKRVPKTTSGKIQRHLLEEDYVNGVYAAELNELAALRAADEAAGGAKVTSSEIERKIKDICDAALERNMDVNDNLFEIGASSLKLIEIHEQIDRIYPGLVDLTEMFDFPTIAELSRHLEGKLAATA
jgi:acyl-CoA synthetase (AMP-forming)/AMP-acid ligase II